MSRPYNGGLLGPLLTRLATRSEDAVDRWISRARSLRGCESPVRLVGESIELDASTGEVRSRLSSEGEPGGELLVPCKNRRASRCEACSQEYRRDTYHLIKAGVCGGSKGVPASVAIHPRVFATLTAPSFGPVHRGPDAAGKTQVCHPRRTGVACWKHHRADDPAVGQPLDQGSYDYTGHVLWHAHAGMLWHRLMLALRSRLAARVGLSRADFDKRVRVSYAKVAEFQTRGVVHYHAVIRLDGRTRTPGDWPPPPVWASIEALCDALAEAAAETRLTSPEVHGQRWTLAFGDQVDVRPIEAFAAGQELSETAVAGYIAKYATKGAEAAGTLDRRITDISELHRRDDVRPHAARLIYTCWRLGNPRVFPQLEDLKLRTWAHMLGFRGHFSTKSRRYSTTLGALRQARADYRAGHPWDADTHTPTRPAEDSTLVISTWRFTGQGLTSAEWALADMVAGCARKEAVP